MPGEEGGRKKRGRSRDGDGSGVDAVDGSRAVQDGQLSVEVTEMLVWSKMSRGDYNRNQAYAHVYVTPSAPWAVTVPVGEREGPEAVRQALSVLQDAVHAAVLQKAEELEEVDKASVRKATSESLKSRYGSGVEVKTQVSSVEERPPVRPSIEASVGEPPDNDEDF